jgi:hypothetical protein
MTRLSCPSCRLRFSAAATATLTTCPECQRPVDEVDSATALIGYRLFAPTPLDPALPMAAEAALPIPDPGPGDA